ncbi:dihydrolipoyllysine-residue succinyltransferase [Theileria parva strain Muguga]|uniref:dihydrolipoyllysine-residue succinyltransferase n=1 Tax=Theileria parva TaxID=5875 RepID=Q4N952_THEPA|nr:dihydrolipoyllysine-residue succinyltransferase [Theileria parva strain Muguga]EAN33506.1 dihydrolipoyllysine-residue succinyltransferase [Theileria parva strain Muguga]|eukprot:XP_765789.1 dihydrolipoamide succinyltransferase [Theileria parva strain Muguga]
MAHNIRFCLRFHRYLNSFARNKKFSRFYSVLPTCKSAFTDPSTRYTNCFVLSKSSDFNPLKLIGNRYFSKDLKVINVPTLGDSISEGTLTKWAVSVGDYLNVDDLIAVVETDKVSVDVNSPFSGVLTKTFSNTGDTILVGKPLVEIDLAGKPSDKPPEKKTEDKPPTPAPSKPEPKSPEPPKPSDSKPVSSSQVKPPTPVQSKPLPPLEKASSLSMVPPTQVPSSDLEPETRVPLTRMRMRIAERLKHAQTENVMLTTFNECDMSELTKVRKMLNESGEVSCKLGFVSAFMRASTLALLKMPIMNSYIEGNEMVTKNYVDISVAVATPTGLLVPVIRNCEFKNWEELELSLLEMAKKAREGSITIEDMTGGTFTISNGGVYGSLLSTPIINPPQSSILGMHAITKRPVVRDDNIVIRPVMNVALTYDHRLIDGRDAVTFLNTIKKFIENPSLLLLK